MSGPSGFKEQTPQPSDAAKALGPKDPGIDGSVFGSECACGCQQRVAQYRDAIAHTLDPKSSNPDADSKPPACGTQRIHDTFSRF